MLPIRRTVLGVLAAVATLAGPSLAAAQGLDEGRVQSFYFDTLGYTEVWVNLTPAPQPGERVSAITLNLTVRLPGKASPGFPEAAGPIAIIARAQSNDLYNPGFVRQPVLWIEADGTPVWDPQLPVHFFGRSGLSCLNCGATADTVEIQVPANAIEILASAQKLAGNALGFEFELNDAQVETVRRFAAGVLGR